MPTTMGNVNTPPVEPPVVGLIAALQGTPYLLDDSGQPLDDALNDSGQPDDTGVVRWFGGVHYMPEQTCYSAGAQNPCSPSFIAVPPNPEIVDFMPYLVWAGDECTALGWNSHDYRGRVTRALLAAESKQIAHELWGGTLAKASLTSSAPWPNHWLASPAAQIISAGPQTVANALSFLEQGLADASNGQRGAIHCSRMLGSLWSELGNTFKASTSGQILTYMGTAIIPDAGYDGSAPNGSPAVAGSQWAYATLMPTVRRGPISLYPDNFAETGLHLKNTVTWRANRLAVATFSPCVLLACEVNVPLPLGGIS
jgi:hypothetical protein